MQKCAASCSVTNSSRSLWLITFGAGRDPYSQQTPSHFNFTTTYRQQFESRPAPAQFALMNKVPNYDSWHAKAEDYTPDDTDGYMMLVDLATYDGSVIFNTTVHGLCIDSQYEFSAYFANIVQDRFNASKPNIILRARAATHGNEIINQSWTDDLPELPKLTWSKHQLLFTASTSSVVLLMIAKGNDGIGRDLVIDDIELRVCSSVSSGYYPSETTAVPKSSEITSLVPSSWTISQFASTSVEKGSKTVFIPKRCPNASYIGKHCNISNDLCEMMKPCKNNTNCKNTGATDKGYVCICPPGSTGVHCEENLRPCASYICLNNGKCDEKSVRCRCPNGWEGDHCESMINHCEMNKTTCSNNGVCRPLVGNYTCECFGTGYSGRHCEIVAVKIRVFKILFKSVAFVAILIIVSFILFIVIMDILKYCFGIDVTREELERYRREKRARKRRRPVIQRFVYVDKPQQSSDTSV
ncbi:unnamed protein product [Adineta ricciae]|uniref:EGF-like domain-containing protein n=1 Tax=Adineta ricciae TaxID=249248 RepID=A0A815D470_ADIRI|nr:unnamed protein product [Adineta ricciae]CAF1468095.1 unnamed protein product [Adineta ricciae]